MKTSRNSDPKPGTHAVRVALHTLGAGCVFAGASPWVNLLGFDPAAIAGGETWRLLTGHIAHLSWPHAAANALGLGIALTVLYELVTVRALLASVLFIVVGIDAIFMLPGFQTGGEFAGFSGVLYGLAALISCLLIGKLSLWAAGIATTLAASVAFSLAGWSPWGFETAAGTHVAGMVLGVTAGTWLRLNVSSPGKTVPR